MGLSVSGAFSELSVQFAIGYVLVRVMTVLMYVRTYFSHPQSRAYAMRYMVGFAVGTAIWVVAIFLPSDVQWIPWLVAIVFEALWFARPVATADEIEDWRRADDAPDHHLMFCVFLLLCDSFCRRIRSRFCIGPIFSPQVCYPHIAV